MAVTLPSALGHALLKLHFGLVSSGHQSYDFIAPFSLLTLYDSCSIHRLAVLVWMFTGIVLISNFTAAITTQNTLEGLRSEINGLSDLPGKTIATVEGSTANAYLTDNNFKPVTVQNIQDAYLMMERGSVDVIVYDAPVLQYYASNEGKGRVELVDDIFKLELYGIALAQNSPYRETINRAILEIKLDGTYQSMYDKWFNLAPPS